VTAPARDPIVYVSGAGPGMHVYRFDARAGALRPTGVVTDAPDSGYAAFSPDRRRLYVLAAERKKIVAFTVDARDGALTRINEASTAPGTSAPHVAVHPSGRWLFLAFYGSGHVTVHPIAADGSVGAASDEHQPGKNAHMAVSDAAGRFLLVPCLGSDHVAQFAFDATTGKLTPNDPPTVAAAPGSGPRHMAFHPNGRFAFVTNELDGTVTAYAYDAATGRLAPIQTLPTVPEGYQEKAASHVVVHPSGRFLYTGNRRHASIAVFTIDQASGRLAPVAFETAGGQLRSPRHFAIDPTGRWLLSVNQQPESVVAVFAIDATTGRLTLTSTAPAPPKAEFVAFLP